MRRFVKYAQLAVSEFLDDNGAHLSASVSYYILFSLFPLLLAVTSILGFVLGSPERVKTILDWFSSFLPAASAELIIGIVENNITDIIRLRGFVLVLSIFGFIWAGTSMFNVVRKTLNIIWGITIPRPFFHERLVEIIMMAGVGSLFIASFWVTIFIKLVRQYAPGVSWAGAFYDTLFVIVLPGY